MATRSMIGVKTPEGIRSIYCHWDGYPNHVGRILMDSYDYDSTIKLMDLGYISQLSNTIESCVSYIRDRGESAEDNQATIHGSITEFMNNAVQHGANFYYILMDGEWKGNLIGNSPIIIPFIGRLDKNE